MDENMDENIVTVRHLTHRFRLSRKHTLTAVDDVSFSIRRGEILGLVGESGCGKSTVARCMMNLYRPTGGEICFNGINTCDQRAFRANRKLLQTHRQLIFQDSTSSLNQRMQVADIIAEPMRIHHIRPPRGSYRQEAAFQLHYVGMDESFLDKYPSQMSGGQRQRVAIARALAMEPELLVADEPIASLDVSIQAQIINLLKELQRKRGLTYLFVAHDMSVIRYISDRVGVMYLGSLVEVAETEELYRNNLHPYSKALLSAIPIADPEKAAQNKQILLEGEVPSPLNSPVGCKFASRCPYAKPECREAPPPLRDVGGNHYVACYLV